MNNHKHLTLIVIAGVTALSTNAQPVTTTTAASTRTTALPPFGLGTTETARINLTNIAVASQAGTAASCEGSVAFLNAVGATIGTATTFKIATLGTTSVSLPFTSAGLTGPRGVVRAAITVNRPATSSTSPAPPCSLLSSLETFETVSGATHLYVTDQIDTGGFGGGR